MSMLERARAIADELVRLRRDIHAHPELGFQERRTAALVAETLSEIGGITVTTGVARTGVLGELGNGDGPTIAIRADMDALPILSETNSAYNSTNPGVHHACGHDAHTAMLLGAAHLLREEFAKGTVKGKVKFLFQPSEEKWDAEGNSGGSLMTAEGLLSGVDSVIALHVDSTAPVGTVNQIDGWASAAVDSFAGYVYGTGGHGAMPHTGTDPVHMLIPVLTALFGIRSRLLDPMEPGILSIGEVRGGGASNVIPSEIFIQGTLRSFSDAVREKLASEVIKAFKVAEAFGGRGEVTISRGYPAGYNDPRVSGWLGETARDLLGEGAITPPNPGMGAEDFAYMTRAVPGAMLGLGAAIPDGIVRAHHTPIFDIDERALPIGTAILAETALRFLRGERQL
jgi:amidohydrolase